MTLTAQCGRCGKFIGDCMPTDCPGDMWCNQCNHYVDQCTCKKEKKNDEV